MKTMIKVVATAVIIMSVAVGWTAAQEDTEADRTITVSGTGISYGEPDIARITLGVERTGEDISSAYQDVNQTIDAIISTLTDMNVNREDIQTTDLSIFTEERPGEGTQGEIQRQFRVQNRVNVTVRDLDMLESIIDGAVGAGANNIFGLNFDITNAAELEATARVDALEQARERATQIADALSISLGQVQTVVEEGDSFVGIADRAEAVPTGGGGAAIERGQLSVSVRVRVTYRISD